MAECGDVNVLRESGRPAEASVAQRPRLSSSQIGAKRRPLHGLGVMAILLLAYSAQRARATERPQPRIVGIERVRIFVTDEKKAEDFYYGILRAVRSPETGAACAWCERVASRGPGPIEFETAHGKPPVELLRVVVFRTTDAEGLRDLLKKKHVKVGRLRTGNGSTSFSVFDPEQHQLVFVDAIPIAGAIVGMPGAYAPGPSSWPPIIHAGFVVKDRAAMDHFYKEILGFRLYCSGGMKDGETNWVAMQVPDGTDWIEYMLDVPANADKSTLGVMNHISLGVVSVEATEEQLEKAEVKLPEEPKIGRDGKWQFNLYEPDGTRVELMEFTPVEKPCCSEFTGPHPKP